MIVTNLWKFAGFDKVAFIIKVIFHSIPAARTIEFSLGGYDQRGRNESVEAVVKRYIIHAWHWEEKFTRFLEDGKPPRDSVIEEYIR